MMPVAKCPQVDQKARGDHEERSGMPPRKTPGRMPDRLRPVLHCGRYKLL